MARRDNGRIFAIQAIVIDRPQAEPLVFKERQPYPFAADVNLMPSEIDGAFTGEKDTARWACLIGWDTLQA